MINPGREPRLTDGIDGHVPQRPAPGPTIATVPVLADAQDDLCTGAWSLDYHRTESRTFVS